MSDGFFKAADQFVDTRFISRRYIERVESGEWQCLYNGIGYVPSIDKVPGLPAVTVDGNCPAHRQEFTENADYAAFPFFSLPFSVYIGKAEHRRIETVQFMIDPQIVFRRHFRNTIR